MAFLKAARIWLLFPSKQPICGGLPLLSGVFRSSSMSRAILRSVLNEGKTRSISKRLRVVRLSREVQVLEDRCLLNIDPSWLSHMQTQWPTVRLTDEAP